MSDDAEFIGAKINAFTSKDVTAYYIKSTTDKVEDAFEILSDIFVNAIRSEKLGKFGDYKITADLRIQNPLFGNKLFDELIDSRHASPCEDEYDELKFIQFII